MPLMPPAVRPQSPATVSPSPRAASRRKRPNAQRKGGSKDALGAGEGFDIGGGTSSIEAVEQIGIGASLGALSSATERPRSEAEGASLQALDACPKRVRVGPGLRIFTPNGAYASVADWGQPADSVWVRSDSWPPTGTRPTERTYTDDSNVTYLEFTACRKYRPDGRHCAETWLKRSFDDIERGPAENAAAAPERGQVFIIQDVETSVALHVGLVVALDDDASVTLETSSTSHADAQFLVAPSFRLYRRKVHSFHDEWRRS
ncbi:MAG: hypothetical protein AAFV29_23795, partial [Myxococcota bacterium]